MNEEYHGQYYGRGQNLARLLRKAYDDALKDYDVLIMPTLPFVAQKLPGMKLSFEGKRKHILFVYLKVLAMISYFKFHYFVLHS